MLVVEVITACAVLMTASLGWINRKKIIEVHALVNQRLTDALSEIGSLRQEIGGLKGEDPSASKIEEEKLT